NRWISDANATRRGADARRAGASARDDDIVADIRDEIGKKCDDASTGARGAQGDCAGAQALWTVRGDGALRNHEAAAESVRPPQIENSGAIFHDRAVSANRV